MIRYAGFDDLLERRAASEPGRIALLTCNGHDEVQGILWAELLERVETRGAELHASRASCEAILADGTAACVVEVFAAMHAGLQVALVDPLIPNPVMLPLLHAVDANCVWASDAGRRQELEHGLKPAAAPAYGARTVLFFTSGTTSSAKAVALTDSSLMASAFNGSALMPLTPDDTLLCTLPLSHVFGFVCGLLWGLACGATVALGRGPRHYADDFAVFDPTAVAVVPRLLNFLVTRGTLGGRLGLVLVGASDCPDALLDAVRERGIRASLGYGLTETSSGVALSTGNDFHAMTVCPEDEVSVAPDGEILVKAPTCLMRGYYRDEASTAAAVRDGVLHTGDRGYLDEAGLLHVQGRLKDVLALPNGTKVFLPEYEAAVAAALGERDFAVVLHQGKLVLACGQLLHARDARTLMEELDTVMAAYPPSSRIGRVTQLGHPLPRTAAGDVERWKIQEELEHGDC